MLRVLRLGYWVDGHVDFAVEERCAQGLLYDITLGCSPLSDNETTCGQGLDKLYGSDYKRRHGPVRRLRVGEC